jgi:hypothetical protein
MFTHLLLLKKGGYTTYFGPIGDRPGDCSVMLDYFAGALGREIKPFQNPAEFILEVTGSGTHTRDHHAIPQRLTRPPHSHHTQQGSPISRRRKRPSRAKKTVSQCRSRCGGRCSHFF